MKLIVIYLFGYSVFVLSCVCCQEREGGPFHCSVIKSSGRAIKHYHTTPQLIRPTISPAFSKTQ